MIRVVAGILLIFILSFVVFALNFTISVDASNANDSIFSISSVENLSNDKGQSTNPQLVLFDSNVCVAWHNEFYDETADGQSYTQQSILSRKGSDYGKTFSNVTSLADNAAAGSIQPVRLAASDTSVYVAWNNGSGIADHGTISNNEVFLRTGAACGEQPFGNSVMLSSSNIPQMTAGEPPELAASGNFVYAVWAMNNWEDGNTELLFKRSTDHGVTFEKTVNLTADDVLSDASVFMQTINADDNLVDVVWTGYNGTGDKGTFLKRSLDYGETFEKTAPIHVHGSDGNVGIAGDPVAASSNGTLFVVWRDNYYGPSGNFIIYLKAIPAGEGENFGDAIAISDKTREASFPQITVFENNVYVVWEDNTDPENRETFFRASTDGGRTFGKIINLSNNPGDSYHARLAMSDSTVFVVWSDESVGNGDIILRTSTDNGANFGEAINLSNNSGWSASSQIVASKFTDLAYVVWQDGSPGNLDIFFRTISDNSTNNTENSVLSSLQVQEISIYAYQENSIADYHSDKPPLTSIYSGMPIMINGLVKNQNHTGEHFDYITQVIDENGITVYLGIRHQVAVPLGRQIGIDSQVSSPIVLNETGKYTVKVYTWLGSDKVPLPLSSGGIASIDVQQRITQEQTIEIAETYAQANQLSVKVGLDRYTFGDSIIITGRLNATTMDQPLLIQIFDPQGNRDRIDQIDVASDGEYRYSFTAGGLMNTAGVYKIKVSYKGATSAEASFVFDFPMSQDGIFRIVIDDQQYFIQCLVTGNGNKLLDVAPDFTRNSTFPGDASLIVSLSTQSDGTLSLRFAKEFFDANEEFIVFANRMETEVTDESYGDMNVISIDFEAGTEEIIITGDHIIPEFNIVLLPLLLASAISLVAAYNRLR